jgi:hypothetical protein
MSRSTSPMLSPAARAYQQGGIVGRLEAPRLLHLRFDDSERRQRKATVRCPGFYS